MAAGWNISRLKLSRLKTSRLLMLAVAGGSGLLMGCTTAPLNAWPLAWVALAPLWVLLVGPPSPSQTSHSLRLAVGLGLAWGVGFHGLALSWITELHPLTWMGVPWLASVAIALFAWVFITLWGALPVALWAGLLVRLSSWLNLRGHAGLRILLGVALWCGLETLRSYGPLEWTTLAFTQSPHNVAILHLGRLSGPQMVTGAIALVNGLLAEAWLLGRGDRYLWVGLLWLGLHGVGLGLYSQPLQEAPAAALTVGIVQGNIPTRIKLFEEGVQQSLDRYTQGYETLAQQGVDAVLMPEGTFPWPWIGSARQSENRLYRALLNRGVPVWLGSVGLERGQPTQSLFSLSGSGQVVGRYDKIKLVPLGEYVPFESLIGHLIDRLSPVGASLVPGRSNQHFETPFGRAIAGICYDSAFAWLFREQTASGGQFIVTASNNDPYGAAMMAQHHAQDVMRAIESDRWAARATNTGFSGIVDPHGRTQWISGFRTYETHAHRIYRRQTRTLYVRWGDWLTPLLVGGTVISLLIRNSIGTMNSVPRSRLGDGDRSTLG